MDIKETTKSVLRSYRSMPFQMARGLLGWSTAPLQLWSSSCTPSADNNPLPLLSWKYRLSPDTSLILASLNTCKRSGLLQDCGTYTWLAHCSAGGGFSSCTPAADSTPGPLLSWKYRFRPKTSLILA